MKIMIKSLLAAVMVAGAMSGQGALPRESHWSGDSVLQNESGRLKTFLWALPTGTDRFSVGIRDRNLHSEPKRKYGRAAAADSSPAQGVCAISENGDTLSVMLTVHRVENPLDADEEVVARVCMRRAGEGVIDETFSLSRGLMPRVSTTMSIRITADAYGISVEAGDRGLKKVAEYPGVSFYADSVGFILEPGAKVNRAAGAALGYDPLFLRDEKIADVAELGRRIATSADPLEGVWEHLDRQMDESLLRPGGEYRLMIAKTKEDTYNIYYLDGARINPGRWRAGMKKGELSMTSPGRYTLLWRDAEGEWMLHGLKAAMEEEGILSLLFPYHTSSVRLRRIR